MVILSDPTKEGKQTVIKTFGAFNVAFGPAPTAVIGYKEQTKMDAIIKMVEIKHCFIFIKISPFFYMRR
jgi:hypothetical protein